MLLRSPLLLGLLSLVCSTPVWAASQSVEQEYEQVRTIALRDPRVRAAYEDADRRLQAKIIQIDPALASYHRRPIASQTPSTRVERPQAPLRRFASAPSGGSAATKPKSMAAPTGAARSHTVLQGETLSSIASIYGVTVGGLKASNHIDDERKLKVGQVLSVPPRIK